MLPFADVSEASWLGSRRARDRGTVGYYVPDSPEVVLRILHRVEDPSTLKPLRWCEVGDGSILSHNPGASFNEVVDATVAQKLERSFGELDDGQFAALIGAMRRLDRSIADPVFAGIWVGTSAIEPSWWSLPTFDGAGRDCFLVDSDLDELLTARRQMDQTLIPLGNPYCWWLPDRSTFVTTDIDLDSTFVATTNVIAAAIEAMPEIESVRVSRSRGVTG